MALNPENPYGPGTNDIVWHHWDTPYASLPGTYSTVHETVVSATLPEITLSTKQQNVLMDFDTSRIPWSTQHHKGKVCNSCLLADGRRLEIRTDRMSANNVKLKEGIPGKGNVLAKVSAKWFGALGKAWVNHHFLTNDFDDSDFPPELQDFRWELEGRSFITKNLEPIALESVVRSHITGSGWDQYQGNKTGLPAWEICGVALREGYLRDDKLDTTIWTPTEKTEEDDATTYEKLVQIHGRKKIDFIKFESLRIFAILSELAEKAGIILPDTKLEFGEDFEGKILLMDEVGTPDSSRFWPKDAWKPGQETPSMDKDPIRRWLKELQWGADFDKKNPPAMPDTLIEQTSSSYREIMIRVCEILTDEDIEEVVAKHPFTKYHNFNIYMDAIEENESLVCKNKTAKEAQEWDWKVNMLQMNDNWSFTMHVFKNGCYEEVPTKTRLTPEEQELFRQQGIKKDWKWETIGKEGFPEWSDSNTPGATYTFTRKMEIMRWVYLSWIGKHTNPKEPGGPFEVNDTLEII